MSPKGQSHPHAQLPSAAPNARSMASPAAIEAIIFASHPEVRRGAPDGGPAESFFLIGPGHDKHGA